MLRNLGPYDSRLTTHLAGGAGPVQIKEGMMRQKWGFIRAVSVATLFSAVGILNNGSRAIHTLLEIPATIPAPIATPANEGKVFDGLAPSKPSAAATRLPAADDQTDPDAGNPRND